MVRESAAVAVVRDEAPAPSAAPAKVAADVGQEAPKPAARKRTASKGKKAQASPSLFKRMLSLFTGPEEEAAPKRDAKPKRTKSVKAAQAQQATTPEKTARTPKKSSDESQS
ncbi:hypothetical protein N9I05_05110, partial [Pseudomonadales bacterium]|nr:hypothetical protein [Pseudomonadales bacterium]